MRWSPIGAALDGLMVICATMILGRMGFAMFGLCDWPDQSRWSQAGAMLALLFFAAGNFCGRIATKLGA